MIINNQQELFTICSTKKSCEGKSGYQVIMVLKVASENLFFGSINMDPGPFWPMDPGSGIRDGPKIKIRIRIRIRDKHRISESLETIFWVKMLKFFEADPDLGFFLTLGWEKFGSEINIPDPQHWWDAILPAEWWPPGVPQCPPGIGARCTTCSSPNSYGLLSKV